MNKKLFITLIAIGVGGALGTLLRYTINIQTMNLLFPLGTLIENLIGSFLLGLLTGWIVHVKMNEEIKTGVGVGFCGGFTTMSTLAADVYSLFKYEQLLLVISYISISVFGGVAIAFLGYFLGENRSANYQLSRKVGEVE